MSKMDRQGVRTAAELERKYQFGKNFSEVLGVALDAQTHAVKAEEAVQKMAVEVGELSVLLKDEENGLQAQIEAKLDTDKLVSQFNMAFNEITITSDNFSLTPEGEITAKRGLLGGWDISETSIFKNTTRSIVQITAPESDDSDFITVSALSGNVIERSPLRIKANGDIYTNGRIISANEDYSEYTEITNGKIVANSGEIGGWNISGDRLSKSYFVDENVLYSVSLSASLYNPNGDWDIDTAIGNSTMLRIARSDGNGTKNLFYIRPNGYLYAGSKDTDHWVRIQNGAIFVNGTNTVSKTDPDKHRILLMYFTGGNNETVGLWATGFYADGNFVYTGLSVETP